MQEFLSIALSMPTLGFSLLLGVVLLYWVSVIVGAVDLDVLDGGLLDGGADGAAEAAADAVAEAMGEAAGEAGDGDADGDGEGSGGLLHALRLRYAPLTVVISFVALFGWIFAFFGSRYALPLWPGALGATLLSLGALALALPLTSLVTRPLAPLFETDFAKGNEALLGAVVVVRSGHVDDGFGQAELDDGQAGLLLAVRCDEVGALRRGDRALIVGWDEAENAFELTPLDVMLEGRAEA